MQRGVVLGNDFLVTAAPAAAYYIPDFITVEEEEHLLRKASLTQCIHAMTRASRIKSRGLSSHISALTPSG